MQSITVAILPQQPLLSTFLSISHCNTVYLASRNTILVQQHFALQDLIYFPSVFILFKISVSWIQQRLMNSFLSFFFLLYTLCFIMASVLFFPTPHFVPSTPLQKEQQSFGLVCGSKPPSVICIQYYSFYYIHYDTVSQHSLEIAHLNNFIIEHTKAY